MIGNCFCPICRIMLIESLPEDPALSDSCPIVFLRPYWDLPAARFAAQPDASTVNSASLADDVPENADS